MSRLRSVIKQPMPLSGRGRTCLRFQRLIEVGREDLSLARLAEAHWDAVAILDEAGRSPEQDAIYGVWASEIPGCGVRLDRDKSGLSLQGTKMFCSGAGLLDRALVTVNDPEKRLVDIDLRHQEDSLRIDNSEWKTSAFAETNTATVTFTRAKLGPEEIIGEAGWYLSRPGFWLGACSPAACWAGGAIGLLDWALFQDRRDPHTLAHLAAMNSEVWALRAYIEQAGREIDLNPADTGVAHVRALTLRHLVERACTEILRRLPRAYGPHPLAMLEDVSRRYYELDLYLRQSHAERDLESLGSLLTSVRQ